ncbi:methionine ABC transporter permease [Stomatobaculum sp. F0698]|nr:MULTISPECIES: methionine ABC transporter permease [Stomatobaculum]WLD87134.1 methionine ABC transporter permease [Stomatobaculum sp. F0698]
MIFNSQIVDMLLLGLKETVYMVFLSSFLSYVIGIPLGILLVVTDRDGIQPNIIVNTLLGIIINILRSVPFIIMLLAVLPITRFIVRTTLGPSAVVVPLVIAASPYIARMVESSLKEMNAGIVEAAKSMGASNFQIIWKVMLPESMPSLLTGAAISITTILGYSTMAGFVGGGGLGTLAINYGYYRYRMDVMMVTVVVLVIIVQLIQEFFLFLSRRADKRAR